MPFVFSFETTGSADASSYSWYLWHFHGRDRRYRQSNGASGHWLRRQRLPANEYTIGTAWHHLNPRL